MGIRVEVLRDANDEVVAAFARLLPQLSRSAPPLTRSGLDEILRCSANNVLLARADGRIVGALTLVLAPIPTGVRALIEDVVVDDDVRGHGVGSALVREAIQLAAEAGARTVDLTSRPSRTAANRLYQRLGFELRDTNVYRFRIDDTEYT